MGGDVVADPSDNSIFWSGGARRLWIDDTLRRWIMLTSKTTDGGATWQQYPLYDTLCDTMAEFYPIAIVNAVVIDPSNSDVVYAGGYKGYCAGLFKTTDGGQNWLDIASGLSDTVFALAINPENTAHVYAGTDDGIFKSTDAGMTWVNKGLSNVQSIVIDPNVPNIVNAGTKTGVYVSFSGGTEWQPMNSGLGNLDVRWLELNPGVYLFAGTWGNSMYRCVPEYDDVWPPSAPHIAEVQKSGSNAIITWHPIATDTLGNPETIDRYVVYRSTNPSFIPGSSDSIGAVLPPDTTYTDVGVVALGQSYYYLVKAVDGVGHQSRHSNMGYVFHKVLNENPATTDRNWVSLPWHNNYAVVSALTTDVSAAGDPLVKVTNLRNDQKYESWLWDPDFGEWYGEDFVVEHGQGYEMVTVRDTTVVLVGYNDPAGLVSLNENPATTDRNWVSIPYNHVYSAVSDITTEYSPSGNPLVKVTNLRDDQKYESWLWDPDFGEWYGEDFVIERGRGYEMVTMVDTTWNPTEYSNESGLLFARPSRQTDMRKRLGTSLIRDRAPVWVEDKNVDTDAMSVERRGQRAKSIGHRARDIGQSAAGISHIVRLHITMKDFENLVFTAYCPGNPYDVLTENMVGSGSAEKQGSASLWFDAGNFEESWVDKKEVLLIVEATKQGCGYCAVTSLVLDRTLDVEDLGTISLVPISDLKLDDRNIIGYSVYKGDKRLNTRVLTAKNYRNDNDIVIRPVFRGGYETVYGSCGAQSNQDEVGSLSYGCDLVPNPCVEQVRIDYALPQVSFVELMVYDICGRQVKTLVSEQKEPGYYSIIWDGTDNAGKGISSGVYFLRFNAGSNTRTQKLLMLR